jgi:hypothetical protein
LPSQYNSRPMRNNHSSARYCRVRADLLHRQGQAPDAVHVVGFGQVEDSAGAERRFAGHGRRFRLRHSRPPATAAPARRSRGASDSPTSTRRISPGWPQVRARPPCRPRSRSTARSTPAASSPILSAKPGRSGTTGGGTPVGDRRADPADPSWSHHPRHRRGDSGDRLRAVLRVPTREAGGPRREAHGWLWHVARQLRSTATGIPTARPPSREAAHHPQAAGSPKSHPVRRKATVQVDRLRGA